MRRNGKNSFRVSSATLDTDVDKPEEDPDTVRLVAKKGTKMSKFISKSLRRFLRDEDGPTAVEYAVMVSAIAVGVIASVGQLAVAMKNSYNSSGAAISSALSP